MEKSIKIMVDSIEKILSNNSPSIYLYGSVVLEDFRIGWSDIDILCITQTDITIEQTNGLLTLRQELQKLDKSNPYYSIFEGAILSKDSILNDRPSQIIYWGTGKEAIEKHYKIDSFSLLEIINNGKLLYGNDIRNQFQKPTYKDLYSDIKLHYETIRKFAKNTNRSIYSFGWLLDISRCIYTLRTGKIISKTDAGKWALENNICNVANELEIALNVRENPMKYKDDDKTLSIAENLGNAIQKHANVLECQLKG